MDKLPINPTDVGKNIDVLEETKDSLEIKLQMQMRTLTLANTRLLELEASDIPSPDPELKDLRARVAQLKREVRKTEETINFFDLEIQEAYEWLQKR